MKLKRGLFVSVILIAFGVLISSCALSSSSSSSSSSAFPSSTGSSSSSSAVSYVTNVHVITLAGTGVSGANDGVTNTASFNHPSGVAMDSSGNIYIADTMNEKIRIITTAGIVSTFAGSGNSSMYYMNIIMNGFSNTNTFYNPTGVAVDSTGNVYVADMWDQVIRKISPPGITTIFAGLISSGCGVAGYANGGALTAAEFNYPTGVAVDSTGNVYVADFTNNVIRKITSGIVSTLAGSGAFGDADGTGTAASFNYPISVAVDSSGNVYVADTNNNKIRKITPAGVVSTLAGSGAAGYTDGISNTASFNSPIGVAVDSHGNVYVADTGNHKIREITTAGVVFTLAGSGANGDDDGSGTTAAFYNPTGIAVDSSGNIYVSDTGDNKIRKITH